MVRRFEQSQADPCVFRRVPCKRVVVVTIVVHVDDFLVTSATKRDEEQAMENDIHSSFHIKDLGGGGGAGLYLGRHITRDRTAGLLKTRPTPLRANSGHEVWFRKQRALPRTMLHKQARRATKCVASRTGRWWRPLMWASTMTRPDLS